MKRFVLPLRSKDKDPVGSGELGSYFWFYKWGVGGEVWFPVDHPSISEGDELWVVLHENVWKLLGLATVLRVLENHSTGKWEIWWDDDMIQKAWCIGGVPLLSIPIEYAHCQNGGFLPVPEYTHKAWMELLHAPSS